ncbi:MAG: ComEC/Rec2 family competence protein [Maricaulaceae bacterium]
MAFLSHNHGQNDSPNSLDGGDLDPSYFWRLLQLFSFIRYITPFDIYVVSFGVGIATYFGLSFEPNLVISFSVVTIMVMFYLAARRYTNLKPMTQNILLCAVFGSLGFVAANLHTASERINFFPDYQKAYRLSGWVEGYDNGRTGRRYMVRLMGVENLDTPPERVRIRGQIGGFEVGDFVETRAVLTGPPAPATPGGYDSRRSAYFKGLGGSGFAIEPFVKTAETPLSWRESRRRDLLKFRYRLSQRIKSQSPETTAGLQAALITGLRQDIRPQQVDALRASGLAHILAISGLHMALFAGSFYSLISWLLASIPFLARQYDVRKFAAIGGIFAATLYLFVSGASVATQRAFIMAVILFLALILDRQALSTRSVNLAALITLWLHPESLLSVGFQMSFAAVLALVVVYRHWADWKVQRGWSYTGGLFMRVRNGIVSLSVTSLVAGFATGLFAIMHFQRWARYGLVGNLTAMPIFTFLVMPMALVTFLLLPFGLERFSLKIMGLGLEPVIWVAGRIEALPEAMLAFKKPPEGFIALYAVCFLLICLGRMGLRMFGGGLALILAMIWIQSPTAIMRVSDKGQVTWQSEAGRYYTLNRRSDRFGRTQFLRGNGDADETVEDGRKLDACDGQGCWLSLKGFKVAIVQTPDLLPEACETSDFVIIQKRAAGPRAEYLCKSQGQSKKVIDADDLKDTGSLDLYVKDGTFILKTAKSTHRKRPWN